VRQGSCKKPHPNPFPHPHMPLCASLRPLVESAPAASHSSISQLASSSNLLLAAHVWRSPEHLLLQMRSESRGSLAPDQAVASARVPKLCVHGGARTRAHRGPSPLVTLMWPLEVGVLQGGWVEQQQHKQEEHASDSSISSSSSRRRARDPQLCARGVCVLAGCTCARACGDRSLSPAKQPQRMQLSSRCKQLSIVLDPARFSLWDRRADRPVCSPAACEERASGGMSACYCFRNVVLGG